MNWTFDEYQATMVSNGLITAPHYKAMGEALWFYLYLLNRVTAEDGVVAGGALLTLNEIAEHFGTHRVTVKRSLDKLEKMEYISRDIIRNKGFKVRITRAKLTRRQRVHQRTSSSDTNARPAVAQTHLERSGGAYVRRDISSASKSLLSCVRTSNKTGEGAITHNPDNGQPRGATVTFDANDPAYQQGLELMKKARDKRRAKGDPDPDSGPLYGLPGTEDTSPTQDDEPPTVAEQKAGQVRPLTLPDPEPLEQPDDISLPEPSAALEPTQPTATPAAEPHKPSSGDLAALRALAEDWEQILSAEEYDAASLRLAQLEDKGLAVKVGVTPDGKPRLGVTPLEKLTEPLRAWIVTHRECLIAAWVIRAIRDDVDRSGGSEDVRRGPDSP